MNLSYAIIRNANYKMGQLVAIGFHNERTCENHTNQDIDVTKSKDNYHLIEPYSTSSYKLCLEKIKQDNNLQSNFMLKGKKQSNVACEFLITSDSAFFKNMSHEEERVFFENALEFVKKKCGEENIISAVVHKDESTPHMHVMYVPVVKNIENSKGELTNRINCSKFWKGKNSYGKLQDDYFEHISKKNYPNLQRGERKVDNEHLSVLAYKFKKEYEKLEEILSSLEIKSDEVTEVKAVLENLKNEVDLKHSEINKLDNKNKEVKQQYKEAKQQYKEAKQQYKVVNKELSKIVNSKAKASEIKNPLVKIMIPQEKNIVSFHKNMLDSTREIGNKCYDNNQEALKIKEETINLTNELKELKNTIPAKINELNYKISNQNNLIEQEVKRLVNIEVPKQIADLKSKYKSMESFIETNNLKPDLEIFEKQQREEQQRQALHENKVKKSKYVGRF